VGNFANATKRSVGIRKKDVLDLTTRDYLIVSKCVVSVGVKETHHKWRRMTRHWKVTKLRTQRQISATAGR
jgi:hypothetical protein